jgi:hypothetical protein
VPGTHDARAAVDVHADVTLCGKEWLSGMEAHPHTYWTVAQPRLRLRGGGQRGSRIRKGYEEGVALRVDLDPL